jgi:peptide/nickel transport system ATP-binding protein
MNKLRESYNTAIMIITHNLGVVAEMSDRVAVMYMGKIVEDADVRTVFRQPLHPYTVGLMRSIPHMGARIKDRLTPIPGTVPDPYSIPQGCAFAPRCPAVKKKACGQEVPLVEVEQGHFVRCTLYMPDEVA